MQRIPKSVLPKVKMRLKRKIRIKKSLQTLRQNKSRLSIFRSNNFLYAQVIDDRSGKTLVQANTREKDFEQLKSKKNVEAATALGKKIAERAAASKVSDILFDRNGYIYHGRVKAIADGAREAGMKI